GIARRCTVWYAELRGLIPIRAMLVQRIVAIETAAAELNAELERAADLEQRAGLHPSRRAPLLVPQLRDVAGVLIHRTLGTDDAHAWLEPLPPGPDLRHAAALLAALETQNEQA